MSPKNNKIFNPLDISPRTNSGYPEPFDGPVNGREKRALGNHAGLKNFGVNIVHIKPGGMSSHRHYHSHQDEFIYVLSGQLTLVTDIGKQIINARQCVGFPAGDNDGHHIINESHETASYIEIGDRTVGDQADYPDIDLRAISENGRYQFYHKDGTPYPPISAGDK